jgi:manganese/iron transport system permease protein
VIEHFLVEPFRSPFMARALVEVLLLGVLGAVVGVHVLLRRLAFLTDALQHTTFPGIAVAYVLGRSLLLGALVAALLTVVLLVLGTRALQFGADCVLALLIAGFFALGVVVVSHRSGYTADLSQLLFGRILDVDRGQLVETLVAAVVVVGGLIVARKELVLSAFDPIHAQALGYRVAAIDLLLDIAFALAIVVAVRAVGSVLVVAFIVTPAAAARAVTRSVAGAMAVGAVFASLLGWIGLAVSYEASVHHGVRLAAGATVVVTYTVGFCLLAGGGWVVRRTVHRRNAARLGPSTAAVR